MQLAGIVFAIFLSTLTCNATAAIYKWVDAQGTTHYSDRSIEAPDDHQQIDDAMPDVHLMQPPDPRVTDIQKANARLREQRRKRQQAALRQRQAAASRSQSRCESYERRLRSIQASLRQGYREPRGNKLREKRREIQARVSAECR